MPSFIKGLDSSRVLYFQCNYLNRVGVFMHNNLSFEIWVYPVVSSK